MDVVSLTSVGMVRKNNEDSCLIIPSWSSLAIKKRICVFAVADGMGEKIQERLPQRLRLIA